MSGTATSHPTTATLLHLPPKDSSIHPDASETTAIPASMCLKAIRSQVQWVLGRDESCAFQFDSRQKPLMISRRQCTIVFEPCAQLCKAWEVSPAESTPAVPAAVASAPCGCNWRISDMQSTNGFHVNQVKSAEAILKHSDVIIFGSGANIALGKYRKHIDTDLEFRVELHFETVSQPASTSPHPPQQAEAADSSSVVPEAHSVKTTDSSAAAAAASAAATPMEISAEQTATRKRKPDEMKEEKRPENADKSSDPPTTQEHKKLKLIPSDNAAPSSSPAAAPSAPSAPTLATTNDAERLLTEFSCPICSHLLYHYQQLPCGHYFCLPCLEDYFNRGQTRCPQCTQEVDFDFNFIPRDLSIHTQADEWIEKATAALSDHEKQERAVRLKELDKLASRSARMSARLKTEMSAAKKGGRDALDINRPWRASEIKTFRLGIQPYSAFAPRQTFCDFVGLTPEYLRRVVTIDELLQVVRNLGIRLPSDLDEEVRGIPPKTPVDSGFLTEEQIKAFAACKRLVYQFMAFGFKADSALLEPIA